MDAPGLAEFNLCWAGGILFVPKTFGGTMETWQILLLWLGGGMLGYSFASLMYGRKMSKGWRLLSMSTMRIDSGDESMWVGIDDVIKAFGVIKDYDKKH